MSTRQKISACTGVLLFFLTGMFSITYGAPQKLRIIVVDTSRRENPWAQNTHKGLCAAFKDFNFLDNDRQIDEYTKNDFVETGTVVIKKVWMNARRKSGDEIKAIAAAVMSEIKAFKPALVFLGDDMATKFVGSELFNTSTPVVFWGVDSDPLKYGYVDTYDHPGHNVTGVYQSGYYKECMESLKKLLPNINTFAILSDGSVSGRMKSRSLAKFVENGQLSLKLVGEVATNSFSEWKTRALELMGKVDAFFVANHATLKDDQGNWVNQSKAEAWYLANIKKPEAVPEEQYVEGGMLFTVNDSGYKQGYEAGRMADMILHGKKSPADIAVITPTRGATMVNKQRAQMLGVDLSNKDFIEEYVDRSIALETYPQ